LARSPIPKRIWITRASRGVSVLITCRTCVSRSQWITASWGFTELLSSMKSLRRLSSSSPVGDSRLIGSLAILSTIRTFSRPRSILSASSSGVGSRPSSWTRLRVVRTSLLMVSIMCTGMRIVRAWSAIARVMAWRIHQVA
jgi:hypothetical protein